MDLIQTRGSRHWRENISSMTMPNISITSVEINGSLAYVNYSIEAVEGGYTAITLVAKKNSAPTSKTDGVTASITQSSTGKLMYLNNSSTYYFAIFAEYNGYTFRTPAVSYNTQSEITFCDTEIRNGVMYNKIDGNTFNISRTGCVIGYDSASSSVTIYTNSTNWAYMSVPSKYSGNIRVNASSITMECEVKITTSQQNILFVLGYIVQLRMAGWDPTVRIAQSSSRYELNWTPPLNNKLNAFHKVKLKLYYRNSGKAYKCELYIDNTLYKQATFSDVADISDMTNIQLTGGTNYTTIYCKSIKVTATNYDT